MNIELTLENKIALFFKAKREETGNSRAKLAEALGIKTTIVTNYELLRSDIQLPVLFKLFDLFMDDTVTIKGFIRDLEFMDFEDQQATATHELPAIVKPQLDLDENGYQKPLVTDENLCKDRVGAVDVGALKTLVDSVRSNKKEKLPKPPKVTFQDKKPTNGFGSGEKKPMVTGSKAVLKVNGIPFGEFTNVDVNTKEDSIVIPTVHVIGNLEVEAEIQANIAEVNEPAVQNMLTESKTENKIVWDE